ncbi:rhodanese-related sulfurtransferase [Isoptericola jiangsuensis]|uniref:Rhodanese-related sulfurtransferase n=1 Tax=Isoptericola jiangsuensis TaxID=548579 RepID=A0A2A9ESH8_9MICO|nr:rhodanese-like domain-containing protein [Isoptericola jiangsuensis]PFG41964.1 rhodanese-related sulfurtransferase [Isoptericola jiangsuensis]
MEITTSHLGFAPDLDPATVAAHFAARLAVETDVSDVHAAVAAGEAFTLVDVRSAEAWDAGHLPGAVHLPGGKVRLRAAGLIDPDLPVVTYCWGPGCNGATRGALAFATLGYRVKEMLGGYEYWVREGFTVETGDGTLRHPVVDPLTNVR